MQRPALSGQDSGVVDVHFTHHRSRPQSQGPRISLPETERQYTGPAQEPAPLHSMDRCFPALF
ncbi:Hypothetical predicted protein, partial [Pelobates cultripes]